MLVPGQLSGERCAELDLGRENWPPGSRYASRPLGVAVTTTATSERSGRARWGEPRVRSELIVAAPFDLAVSLAAHVRFRSRTERVPRTLKVGVCVNGLPAVVEIRQVGGIASTGCQSLLVASTPVVAPRELRILARRLVAADLDLGSFYRIASRHPILGPITESLQGLKPLPPPSLFEMAVIAITEQQLSMAAAFQIRSRLVERFGAPVGDLHIFPTPECVAHLPLRDLQACGLSRRKAEYLKGFAARIINGALDLEALSQKTDAEAAAVLVEERGFGDWSGQYFLGRGLSRADCLPSADVGLRRAVGKCLARGQRLSPGGLERVLAPFRPFRGLAAFYLAAYVRLRPQLPLNGFYPNAPR